MRGRPLTEFGRGTADSASPPGEGDEGRPWRTVHDFGLAASPRQPPSPQPSPSRARENERRLTRAIDPGPSRVVPGLGARKTLTPGSRPGQAPTLSQRRPLRNPSLVARKTPLKAELREVSGERGTDGARTADSASPPGEGEERAFEFERPCKGLQGERVLARLRPEDPSEGEE